MTEFGQWFARITEHSRGPHTWQEGLAADPTCRDRLVRIPTGMGKTAGVVAAWLWNRVVRRDPAWPRRLVFCLPMRVLVEQTECEIRSWLTNAQLLWNTGEEHAGKVGVHLLMGGAESGDWHLWPEHDAVLIGTQDMLLSRALNRGYAVARARWPVEFGLLNQDALWVMDEIQLMDVGLATSAQLQAFRYDDACEGKEMRPCRTWWMSATLQPSWLKSVDTSELLKTLPAPTQVAKSARTGGLWRTQKSCEILPAGDEEAIASLAADKHKPDSLTLVVVNRVDTATAVHERLRELTSARDIDLRLVHSRFRPAERNTWRQAFLKRSAPMPPQGRIIVATQVIEAGVDISAKTLVTELAPWSSLVQRFGRCARYEDESGTVVVVDRGWTDRDAKKALPYELAEIGEAREAVSGLADVAPAVLEDFEEKLEVEDRAALYPFRPRHLLIRREWKELFDTTPDLSGADLDISRFIRSGEELDCLVFWRQVPEDAQPDDDWQPGRQELCPVPFLKARDWLCGEVSKDKVPTKLKDKTLAWVWDWVDGEWRRDTRRGDILPGRTILVESACGGYDPDAGWNPDLKEPVRPADPDSVLVSAQDKADAAQGREDLSAAAWKTIATHGAETERLGGELATAIGLSPALAAHCATACLWHDVGKSHPCFQGSMRLEGKRPPRSDLAKAPKEAWSRKWLYRLDGKIGEYRPGLRHEFASTLALFATLLETRPEHPALRPRPSDLLGGASPSASAVCRQPYLWESRLSELDAASFNLVAYLVASHHGKVRMSLHASPSDQDYRDRDGRGLPVRGIREGDDLPAIPGGDGNVAVAASLLSLEPAHLGLSDRTGPSWTERTLELLRAHGPGALALLEAIVRAADVRASRDNTADPLLAAREEPR